MCEGSIFHRNFPEINGLDGGEGVKDAAGCFFCHRLLVILNTEARSHKVIPLPDSYETLCLCVHLSFTKVRVTPLNVRVTPLKCRVMQFNKIICISRKKKNLSFIYKFRFLPRSHYPFV